MCIAFGLILMTGILFFAGSKPFSCFACGVIGAASIVLMYRRIAVHRRAVSVRERAVLVRAIGISGYLADLGASLLLAALGYLGAVAAASGWIVAFTPYLLLTFFFPWSRIGLCRRSLTQPLSLLCAGMIVGLAVTDRLPHPIVVGVVVWMLWMSAVLAWLRLVLIDRYKPGSTDSAGRAHEPKAVDGAAMLHNI